MGRRGERPRATGEYGVKLVRGPFVRLPPHPGACDDVDDLYAVAARSGRPLAVDLFCGAGGLSLGLEAAGFDVILGVDTDREALETHRHHHAGLSVDWDLGRQDVIERVATIVRKAGVTLVAGGPPCQPFSRAGRSGMRELVRSGRRPPEDQRRDLWQSLLEIVELAQPPAVLMENVPDMALDRDMMVLRTMVERLEELGYAVDERIVDTWRVGVPQFRQRLILVALADGRRFTWPSEEALHCTVRQAISDLPAVEGGWRPEAGASGWADYGAPVTAFQKRAREGVLKEDRHKVFDHITRPVRDDDRLVFDQMTSDTLYSDVAEDLRRYRADTFDDKYKRLDWDEVSRTITAHIAKDGYWYIHPEQPRTLTVREAARIQTFPDHVRFAGPPSAAFRQIGNAVPPLLGEKVGASILACLKGRRRQVVSTTTISSELAAWWAETEELSLPWLHDTTRWGVIQAELLLDRTNPAHIRSLWPLISKFEEPGETLANRDQLLEMAGWIGREDRANSVLGAAHYFSNNPGALDTIEGMLDAPYIMPAVAELAVRVDHDEDEDPIIVTQGVLRLAARVTGLSVDRVNKRSAGRIAVARLVGAGELGDGAHLALIELAESVCLPRAPRCGGCPVRPWCGHAHSAQKPTKSKEWG